MASLESQKTQIVTTLNDALQRFEGLVGASAGKASQELTGLHGNWVKDNLTAAALAIREIDTDKVIALRSARQSTEPVFESHINAALRALQDSYGVSYSINKLFEEKIHFDANQIRTLDKVQALGGKACRRLKIFRSRQLSLLASGWLWVGMLAIALLSFPIYRYGAVALQARQAAETQSLSEVVQKQVQTDIGTVQAKAKSPEKNVVERTSSTVKAIWDLMDTIPKIINAIAGVWAFILLWLRR